MPKIVDPRERAEEIINAALAILGKGGFAKFTLRNIAKQMGGSMSLITHYFPNREALIEGIVASVEEDIAQFNDEVQGVADPVERLHRLIEWAVPLDEWSLTMERARIALLAHRDADPAVDAFFVRLEPLMRGVYRQHVAALVAEEDLELTVDLMRSWISGITLSTVEHPEIWTRERQLRVVDRFVAMLPLREPVTLSRAPGTG
ncbi:TetR/AcrR family transcriptional regulator [Nonomuraea turcica]|uniref:TetR/AcrR family transcriptional regulator n=1 Tax=Nonomuraea sp. G32 TaxID=3067274 RepID=UPI00273B0861|nr:TetR/AcrR family transcriptional regulator [Nonomuraea sp. G32]MDP4502539.1 TetR/AcrR family transcriptional regulator [Nonomuraea sp. G32]